MNDETYGDDELVPKDLRERWVRRDAMYRRRLAVLTATEIAAVRTWRMEEAADIGDPSLIAIAAAWTP